VAGHRLPSLTSSLPHTYTHTHTSVHDFRRISSRLFLESVLGTCFIGTGLEGREVTRIRLTSSCMLCTVYELRIVYASCAGRVEDEMTFPFRVLRLKQSTRVW